MNQLNLFLSFLNKYIPLSEDDFASIMVPYMQERKFARKEIITASGTVEDYFNFITAGLVRKYFVKEGEELNIQISIQGHMVQSQESFNSRKPTDFVIEAIEATTLLSITYDDLNKIFATNASMERMGRLIMTDLLVLTDRWQMSLLKLSPRDRFVQFVNRNPELLQRVPQKYLASLLNIQPETFSRFKHLLKQK